MSAQETAAQESAPRESADRPRVAVVTGGSRGIGRATVSRLAAEGDAVVIGYAGHRESAEAAVREVIAAGGSAVPYTPTSPANGRSPSSSVRPLRTHVDPARDGSEVVSAVVGRIRAEFFRRAGIDAPLTPGSSL